LVKIADGPSRAEVYSPSGRLLYTCPIAEARYLIRSRQAVKLDGPGLPPSKIRLREFNLPDWMRGTRYHRREYLPSRDEATCWCWAHKPIPSDCGDLFRQVVLDRLVR
jgi:hypothetical protein